MHTGNGMQWNSDVRRHRVQNFATTTQSMTPAPKRPSRGRPELGEFMSGHTIFRLASARGGDPAGVNPHALRATLGSWLALRRPYRGDQDYFVL